MTGPCSGSGTGVAKSGFASIQYIGPGAIGGALAGLSGWQGAAVGATLGALTFDLTTFCPSGPPAMPTFTAADIVALLAPIPTAARATAALKFQDFLGNIFWPLLCDCSSGTSTLGAPSSYPSGGPQTNVPVSLPVGTCGSFTQTGTSGVGGGTTSFWLGASPIPRNCTGWRITSTGAIQTSGGVTYYYQMQENGTGSFANTVQTDNFAPGVPHTFSGVIWNPNSTYLAGHIHSVSGTGTSWAQDTLELYCDGRVPGPQSPCCPPDPATQSMLEQLLGMVTLIQRQAAPFSYVYGANHAGLTGHGSFAVSGLLGVSVDVTTLPAQYGVAVGSPEEHFGLGYVNLGTADGWTSSRAIDHDGSLFIPVSGGLYTAVGYSLAPGVEVAVRELVREP